MTDIAEPSAKTLETSAPSDALRDLARAVSIQNIFFLRFACARENETSGHYEGASVTNELFMEGFSVTLPSKFSVRFRLATEISHEGKKLLGLEAVMTLQYHAEGYEILGPEVVAEFCGTIAPYHAWPYFREFAESAFARIGVPGIVLVPLRAGDRVLAGSPTPDRN